MNVKVCTALLALSLMVPAVSMAVNQNVLDQFGGVSAGIAQGMYAGDDFTANSAGDNKSTQGGNVIVGDVSVATLQAAKVGEDLELNMAGGTSTTQGLNVLKGEVAVLATQVGMVNKDVDMNSAGNKRTVQGVNVVNACEGCN